MDPWVGVIILTLCLGREEDYVVIAALAEVEKGEGIALGRLV
jgi:hypothetical protein